MRDLPDIDIDLADRRAVLDLIEHRVAALDADTKHNTGVYVTEIPHNPLNNLSTIDYKTAEQRGYFKLDFLNVNIYKGVRDEAHLEQLIEKEPMWDLLKHNEFVDQLFHLNGHGQILKETCPDSVEKLAAVLSMIRPAKRHLIGKDWTTIFQEVWTKPENGEYYFKKAHSFSYAVAVIVHMNLLVEELYSQL